MAINSTTNLGLALPDQGEWDGTWGTNTNTQITTLIDSAVAGTTTLSTDADVTLTDTAFVANQSRQAIIRWTASNGVNTRNITAPARSKTYVVINAGTGAIVFRGAGPTAGVTIAAGERSVVAWSGTDFVKVASNTAAAAGSNQQIQFNNSGAFGASSDLVWSGTAVGIGETPPNWGIGAVSVSQASSASGFTVGSNYYFNSGYKRTNASTAPTQYQTFSGEHFWYTASAGAPDSAISWTQAMKINVFNDLKVGTGEPACRLDVEGSAKVSGNLTLPGVATTNGVAFFDASANLDADGFFTYTANNLQLTGSATFSNNVNVPPIHTLTSSSASVPSVPTMIISRTTTTAMASQLVGAITWRQTQTDATSVTVATLLATGDNSPGTTNGTLTAQVEEAFRIGSTGGTVWTSVTSAGVSIGTNPSAATAPVDIAGNKLRVRTAKTPASASDTGNAGDICWDSNYVYVCVATNTWKRSALSTW